MKKFARLFAAIALLLCVAMLWGCNNGGETPTTPPTAGQEGPFTVTFDLNGSELKTTTVQPQTVEKGETLKMPEVFVIGENPENWFISGWYTEPECEIEWDFDIDIVDSNMTLYAKWVSDPQVTVTYMAGKDKDSLVQVHTASVSKGLSAEKCDDRVQGYEVLGYYADAELKTAYDFDAPVNEDTTVYIKTSDYIYLSPSYLMTFGMTGVQGNLAADGSSITLNYTAEWNEKENRYIGDTYIFNKAINAATNGYDHLEIVYKLENAERVNIYWFGTHADGTSIEGCNDFSSLLANAGIEQFGFTTWVDAEGWSHAVYDLTRVNRYYQENADRITDIATISGFRLDLDLETAENATMTVKYVKGSHGPEGANITYYVNGEAKSDEFVPAGSKPAGYPRPGRKITYYTDRAMTKVYDITKAPSNDINLYVAIDETHIWFDGTSLMAFKPVAGAALKPSGNNVKFSGSNGAYIYHKELDLNLNGDTILEIKAKLDGCTPGMYIYGAYTLNGKNGASTDYGQDYTRLTSLCQVTDLGNGWSIIKVDLTKIAPGLIMKSIDGLRLDIYGTASYNTEIEYVKSYRGDKHTVTMYVGNTAYTEMVDNGKFVSGGSLLGKTLAYYTDKAMTKVFDPLTPITKDTTLYVKVLDHLYFGGAALNRFNTMGGAETTLNSDGTLTVSGTNGAFIHMKDLGLAMNGDNMMEIRVKLDGATPGIFLFGKYTLNGVAKESTDYGQEHTRIPVDAVVVTVDGDWSVYTIDLTKMAPGFELQVLNGLRFDLYGNGDYDAVIDYVRTYRILRHTVTFVKPDGQSIVVVKDGDKVTSASTLGRYTEFFKNEACTETFDINMPITEDVTIYVRESKYVWFDGEALNRFVASTYPGAAVNTSVTLNADGTFTMTGTNGASLYKKDLNLNMNGDNMLDIKMKMSGGVYGIFIYGKYTVNGVAGESTDYGQTHTRVPDGAITATTDGEWTVLTIDFSKIADGYALEVMNGLRLDIYGNDTYSHTYHSIKSYRLDKYTVTYKGDVDKSEVVISGEKITGSAILGREVEYYTDEACTQAFSLSTPITEDITLYVKVGTHVYFNGSTLGSFNQNAGASAVVNADGTITVTGVHGSFIHHKNLNLNMNGDNMLDIRVKMSGTSVKPVVFIYGKYTVNGVAGESTDYGQSYTNIPNEAITATVDGEWTVLTIDFSKVAQGYTLEVMEGLRLELQSHIGASAGELIFTYDTVKSYKVTKRTVTYAGDYTGTEQVDLGQAADGANIQGYEEFYFTDEACTIPYDLSAPVTEDITVYVKKSTYVYVDGADIYADFSKINSTDTGSLNADGNFVIQPGATSQFMLNWRPTGLTTGGNTKFEVRFKLTGHGNQVAFFTQGTLSNSATLGETGVYYPTNTDGWYTAIFDFSASKLTGSNAGAIFTAINQFRFDVYNCTASTVIEVDYIKSVVYEIPDHTVTYAGDATGTESVKDGETAQGVSVMGREELYFTDEACTVPYDLSAPVTGDITIYVKLSEQLYFTGSDIAGFNGNSSVSNTGVNENGNFVVTFASTGRLNNYGMSMAIGGTGSNVFEVKAKITGLTGQPVLFTQGILSDSSAFATNGVYLPQNLSGAAIESLGDGWYILTFDFSTKMSGKTMVTAQRVMLDLPGATAEIEYIKTVGHVVPDHTVTYAGAYTGTEAVADGEAAKGVRVQGREELYFTDEACTVPYDLATPVTGDMTLYVKLSEYVYVDGADIKADFSNTANGTVNEDGNFVIQPGAGGLLINWRPAALTTGGNTKFEVRFKLTGHGNQVAFFTQGTLSDGGTWREADAVYVPTNTDGWYTMIFDFSAKMASLNHENAVFAEITQLRFDVYGCTADTIIEIDYIKTVKEEKKHTVTYAGDKTGSETVNPGECATGVTPVQGREELYFTDEACTIAYDLATPVNSDITLYVKISEYVYVNGADILADFNKINSADTGSLNADGNFVIQPGATRQFILNWRPAGLTTGGNTKFEVRFKLTGPSSGAEFFTQGTLSDSGTWNEADSVYVGINADGWYTMVFDFADEIAGLNRGDAIFTEITQLRFDVYDCTADTVIEIDYIKSITKAEEYTVTYSGDKTGTEQVVGGQKPAGLTADADSYLTYYSDAAFTNKIDLDSTVITGATTIYVRRGLYLDGAAIMSYYTGWQNNLAVAPSLNSDGNVELTYGAGDNRLNIQGMNVSGTNMNKFVVRVKLPENFNGQAAFFIAGKNAAGTDIAAGTVSVYVAAASYTDVGDGWYDITFDFTGKGGCSQITRLFFNVFGKDASNADIATPVTIAYIKSVTE